MKFKVTFKRDVEGKQKAAWLLISAVTYGDAETQFYKYAEENGIEVNLEDNKITQTKITSILQNKETGIYFLVKAVYAGVDEKITELALVESDCIENAKKEVDELTGGEGFEKGELTKYIDVL